MVAFDRQGDGRRHQIVVGVQRTTEIAVVGIGSHGVAPVMRSTGGQKPAIAVAIGIEGRPATRSLLIAIGPWKADNDTGIRHLDHLHDNLQRALADGYCGSTAGAACVGGSCDRNRGRAARATAVVGRYGEQRLVGGGVPGIAAAGIGAYGEGGATALLRELELRRAHRHHTVGLNTHEDTLAVVEGVAVVAASARTARIQGVVGKVAVVCAAPAPVDVEQPVVVVAVNDESVAASIAVTGLQNGPPGIKIGGNDRNPVGIRGVILKITVKGVLVTEIGRQSSFAAGHGPPTGTGMDIRATAVNPVVHLHGHTHMVHQRGHGVHLRGTAAVGERVGHVIPVVGRGTEIRRLIAEVVVGVAVAAHTRRRPVPVLHNLGGGCCRAPCDSMMACRVGTEVVVNGVLVPSGGQHRRDHSNLLRGVNAVQKTGP